MPQVLTSEQNMARLTPQIFGIVGAIVGGFDDEYDTKQGERDDLK